MENVFMLHFVLRIIEDDSLPLNGCTMFLVSHINVMSLIFLTSHRNGTISLTEE